MKEVVIVTGGSRGIGAAVVRHAAAAGYATAVLYRADHESAHAVCEQAGAVGQACLAIQVDVARDAEVVRAFERVDAELGRPTALINNAGINGGRVGIDRFEAEHLQRVFFTNVLGAMLCTREAVKRMARSHGGGGGVIVNVSSMAATIGGRPGLSHYAASKSALDAFTVGAARELAPEGIRVFAIRPGATETDLTAEGYRDPQRRAAIEGSIAIGRYATPDEIAVPIVTLLSDRYAYLSGAVIDASGGGYMIA